MKNNYPNDWKIEKLNNFSEILVSNVNKKSLPNETNILLCNYMDVYRNRLINKQVKFMKATAKKNEIAKFLIKKEDILITKDSESPDDIAVPTLVNENFKNVLCGYHLAILRPKVKYVYSKYLYYILETNKFRHYFFTLANGVTRFGLSKGSIENALIPLPSIKEQKKIACILNSWDEAIETLEQLIDSKLKLKKALMQKFFFNIKLTKTKKYKLIYLGELFKERKEKNCNNLKLLSITSNKGVVDRNSINKKDTSNSDKSKYLKIYKGDIGYNTMRMWQGVSGLSSLEGIVSPAYTILIPNKNIDVSYFSFLFKSAKMINKFYRYSQGLVNDTLTLKFHNFSKIKVSIPKKSEQEKISKIFRQLESEITYITKYKNKLSLQKKGLMQQLLTGKKRVKV